MNHRISRRKLFALGAASLLSGSVVKPVLGDNPGDARTKISANLLYLCGGSGAKRASALLSERLDSVSRGHKIYEGSSPVFAPLRFRNQWYAACADCSNREGLWRIHRSPDVTNVTNGEVVYEGRSPITAMLVYQDALLTAFSHVGEREGLSRIHRSFDGYRPGSGSIIYEGISPIAGMCEFSDQLYCAFSNVAGNAELHRVHRAESATAIANGEVVYEGWSPVTSMTPTSDGLFCGFSRCEKRDLCRIHVSRDGRNLGVGPPLEEGRSPLMWLLQLDSSTFVAAFADCGNVRGRFRIHRHSSPEGIGRGDVIYEGFNAPTAFVPIEGILPAEQARELGGTPRLVGASDAATDAGNAAAVCALARLGCMNSRGHQSSQHCLAAAFVCANNGANFLSKHWPKGKEPVEQETSSAGAGGRGSADNFEMAKYF